MNDENKVHVPGRVCSEVTPAHLLLIFLIRFALHAAVVLAFARWRTVPGSWAAATLALVLMPGLEIKLSPLFYRLGLWRQAHENREEPKS